MLLFILFLYITGKALFLLKKKAEALKAWRDGSEIQGDVELFEELYKYSNGNLLPSLFFEVYNLSFKCYFFNLDF